MKLIGVSAHNWLTDKLPIGHNITRIDIAMTFWSDLNRDALLALHSLEALGKRNTLRSRPFEVRLIDGFGSGDTLYVGDRSSEMFVRCYDKQKAPNAKPEHKGAIRYEVELKERAAIKAVERLTSGGYSPATCMALLASLLDRRGICAMGLRGVQYEPFPPSDIPVTSLEDSLLWLTKQVRPTIARLMRDGYEEEVLSALGLSRYFNPGY